MAALNPLVSFAANDVTIDSTVNISVGGYTLAVNGSSYTIDSIVVGADSFDVTLSTDKSFGVTSSDRRKLTVSPTSFVTLTNTCNSSESSVIMKANHSSGSITVTVTPSTTQICSAGGGGGAPGSTGGGGGSLASYNYGATPATPTVSPATPAAPALASASPVAKAVSPAFNRELERGGRGEDVTRLQQLLAKDPSIYPEGQVTGFYGALTQKAVRAFQKKYGISQVGRVGPQTLAKLNEVFGGEAPAAAPASSSANAELMSKLQAQIEALLKQIQELQAKKAQ